MFKLDLERITKNIKFLKVIPKTDLPGYIKHYVSSDEKMLVIYKTTRDYGIFTDRKIVLFDNYKKVGNVKHMFTIPYRSISAISIKFLETEAEFELLLESGYPVSLNFIDLSAEDKVRLRILYTCISRIIDKQELISKDVKKLIDDEVHVQFSN